MCTLIVAWKRWPGVDLVVAANRDEQLDRKAEPLARREGPTMDILAPLDMRAGGTWLGLNARGVFVAITNRHDPARMGRVALVSRGQVVIDALAESTAAAAATVPDRRGAAATNGYHLLVADRDHAEVIVDDGAVLVHHALSPGVHVITQSSYGAGEDVRGQRLRARLAERLPRDAPPDLDFWRAELSVHDDASPMDATCIHMPQLGYGTRSSTYVRLGDDPAADAVWHADGRPCEVPYRDHTAQWTALRRVVPA